MLVQCHPRLVAIRRRLWALVEGLALQEGAERLRWVVVVAVVMWIQVEFLPPIPRHPLMRRLQEVLRWVEVAVSMKVHIRL